MREGIPRSVPFPSVLSTGLESDDDGTRGGGWGGQRGVRKRHPLVESGVFDNNDIAFAAATTYNNDDDDRHNDIRYPRYRRIMYGAHTASVSTAARPLINKRRRVRGAIINYSVVKGRVRPTRVFYKFHFLTPLAPLRIPETAASLTVYTVYIILYIYIGAIYPAVSRLVARRHNTAPFYCFPPRPYITTVRALVRVPV